MRHSACRFLAVSSAAFVLATARAATRPHYGGTLRVEIQARVSRLDPVEWPDVAESVQLPLTRAATNVLKSAWREADALSHKTIEPEHILLGILDVPKGTAFKVLTASGVNPTALRGKLAS